MAATRPDEPTSNSSTDADAAPDVAALGQLIQSSPDPMVVHDGQQILYVNRTGLDRLGVLHPDDLVGRSIREFIPGEYQDVMAERVEQVLSRRDPGPPLELPFVLSDGSQYWGEIVSSLVRYRDRPAMLTVIRDITKRRDAEAALRQSEARYRELFDAVPIGLYRSTPDGRLLSANEALVRMLRYPDRETLLATPVQDLYLDSAERAEWRQLAGEAGVVSGVELRLRTYDGEEIVVRLTTRAHHSPDGAVDCFEGALEDVTESRRAEAKFRLVFETTAQGVVFHDRDGWIISANPAAERILGLTREQLLSRGAAGAEWRTIRTDGSPWPPEERPVMVAIREGRPVRGGVMGVHNPVRDELRWIELDSIPLFRAGEDTPYQVYSMFADVTDRRRAEEDLRKSQERLSSIIRAAPLGITLSRAADGVFLEVNERFAQTLGYTRDELLGRSSLDLGLWEDPEDRRVAVRRLEEVGRLRGLTVRFVARSGEVRDMQLFTELIEVAGEWCALTLHQDITESRKLEEQLRQAQKMEAVGRLAGGIAHDFNNLLTAMVGHVEFLLDALPEGDERRADAEAIEASAERAKRLTRQLLAFSRQQMMNPRVVRLPDVVTSFEPLLRRLIGAHVDLQVERGGGPCETRVDPGQLEQVLLNLVVNARDAMPDGGRLTIETGCISIADDVPPGDPRPIPPGRYARLAVRDSGTGMTDETRARVFEPFFTTKPAGKGTGLGLSTVYGIINQSKGYIGVESRPGEGSTFTLYLPVVEEEPAEPVPEGRERAPAERRAGTGTVLVVEDEIAVRALARRVLEEAGYTVHTAPDGASALELLEAIAPIDLLLTDVVMPGMNGRELAERLRVRLPDLPVLYMSGYTSDEVLRDVKSREGGFMEKPFTPDQLVGMVRAALDA